MGCDWAPCWAHGSKHHGGARCFRDDSGRCMRGVLWTMHITRQSVAPCTLQSHVGHRRIVPCACMSGACPVHDRVREMSHICHARCAVRVGPRVVRLDRPVLYVPLRSYSALRMSQVTRGARGRARNEPVVCRVACGCARRGRFRTAMPRRRSARFGLRGRRAGRRAVRVTEARKSDTR